MRKKNLKLKCYVCGCGLAERFAIVSAAHETDRPFVVHIDGCLKRVDSESKEIIVQRAK